MRKNKWISFAMAFVVFFSFVQLALAKGSKPPVDPGTPFEEPE